MYYPLTKYPIGIQIEKEVNKMKLVEFKSPTDSFYYQIENNSISIVKGIIDELKQLKCKITNHEIEDKLSQYDIAFYYVPNGIASVKFNLI